MSGARHLPSLDTQRLTLRAPGPKDLPAYQAFYAETDASVGKYRGGRSDADISTILERDIQHWQDKGFGIWLLRSKDDATVLGGAGLDHADDWDTHELTWWLMPKARSKGYATEASRAIIAFAYDTLGWTWVETFMRDHNISAHRIAQRLGGRVVRRDTFPDGISRDVYALPRGAQA